MSRFILYTILFYLLYKFIVDFLLPVGKASAQVRNSVRKMQEEQQQYARQQQYQQSRQEQQTTPRTETTNTEKDYIDFEEVK